MSYLSDKEVTEHMSHLLFSGFSLVSKRDQGMLGMMSFSPSINFFSHLVPHPGLLVSTLHLDILTSTIAIFYTKSHSSRNPWTKYGPEVGLMCWKNEVCTKRSCHLLSVGPKLSKSTSILTGWILPSSNPCQANPMTRPVTSCGWGSSSLMPPTSSC